MYVEMKLESSSSDFSREKILFKKLKYRFFFFLFLHTISKSLTLFSLYLASVFSITTQATSDFQMCDQFFEKKILQIYYKKIVILLHETEKQDRDTFIVISIIRNLFQLEMSILIMFMKT